jgi:hypothetical protein
LERSIQCVCGRQLIWTAEDPSATAVCPSCGQTVSAAVDDDFRAIAAMAEAAELDFRDQDTGIGPMRARKPLYSTLAVGVAGLLGGILAGSFMLGINYYSLKQKTAAIIAMLAGIITTVAFLILLPDYLDLPIGVGAILPLAIVIGAQLLAGGLVSLFAAWLLQRRAFAFHRGKGSPFAPLSAVVWRSLLCAGLVIGAQILWNYPFAWGGRPPTRTLYYGDGQRLVYSVGIPRETIDGVAKVLFRQGVFGNNQLHNVDVFVLSRGDHVEVRFFVDENVWANDGRPQAMPVHAFDVPQRRPNLALAQYFQDTRQALANGPFRAGEVRVVICNTFGKQLAEFR